MLLLEIHVAMRSPYFVVVPSACLRGSADHVLYTAFFCYYYFNRIRAVGALTLAGGVESSPAVGQSDHEFTFARVGL